MQSSNYTTFYVVRHGETEWNVKKLLQGQGDSPLTTNGINQASVLGEKLRKIHFDAVFSSDLLRAQRTAEIITVDRDIAINTTALLRERAHGKWEGKPYSIYHKELKDLLTKKNKLSYEEKKSFKYPDMESDEEVVSRFITFLRETAVAYTGKTILVVTHGGMMRAILIHIGFGTYDELASNAVSNSAYFQLQSDGIEFHIKETQGIIKSIHNL
ncbi:MAG TPA: histidine phosphatase family protein [Candidatus Saccharimonadales bacterium]|nr:histidine phosphatase family protein [Candidatus Saccharimonadales bacterium]